MLEVASINKTFELAIDKLGVFPNFQQPQILWLGVARQFAALISLQRVLSQNLRKIGLKIEERAYAPHITLARLHSGANFYDKRQLGQILGAYALTKTANFSVNHFELFQSTLTPNGPLYKILYKADL